MKICRGVYESEAFQNDNDFLESYCRDNGIEEMYLDEKQLEEIDEEKMEYYSGDFWSDCDAIKMTNERGDICTLYFVKIGDEIIMESDESDGTIEKILLHYFSKDWEEKSITPDFDRGDWNATLQNGTACDTWIKYRGGVGYTYAFCGYNSKDFE